MSTTFDNEKSKLISQAIDLAADREETTGLKAETCRSLMSAYYRHVAPEDLVDRSPEDLYGALASHVSLAAERPQGTARVRVLTPTESSDGWTAAAHTVVEVVTDDMPFLVDSVTMLLVQRDLDLHVVVHPQFDAERTLVGELISVKPGLEGEDVADGGAVRESWMHVEIDRINSADEAAEIEAALLAVLRNVREAVEDWARMRAKVLQCVEELGDNPPPLPEAEVVEGRALLDWLADDHFTFLGYREYRLESEGDDELLRGVPGTGLGILRADQNLSGAFAKLPSAVKAKAREKRLLVLAKANSRSTVHRPAYLDYVGVKTYENGEVVGEKRILGLFSSAAYTESVNRIPVLREKAHEVMRRVGFEPMSHAGKALMDTLENYPRDELFQTPVDELAQIAEAVLYTRERRQLRLFLRRETYGRYISCLVYMPRDRYNTAVRERISALLKEKLGGESVEFTVRVSESNMARVHFVVRPPQGGVIGEVDPVALERDLAQATRSWADQFSAAVTSAYGDAEAGQLVQRYASSFPEAYKEDFSPQLAAIDVGRLEGIAGDEGIDLEIRAVEGEDASSGDRRDQARLKFYRIGPAISLSDILPMLTSMGVEVLDERPYRLDGTPRSTYVYEFGMHYAGTLDDGADAKFSDALRATWEGRNEVDGFNGLVLAAGLTWRQASLLRAYAKYMRQGGTPFAQDYIEGALLGNLDITRLLVRLFEARFAPGEDGTREAAIEESLVERIHHALDDVASLDHDRILRSYLTHIQATLRTNYFRTDDHGELRSYLSFKFDPEAIPDLPMPRPRFEIWVYSPRVEGVHLRFGPVARGGLRWSDRRDDFRTEVLGLVKAQMVKNTVIVPVGSKGGFFAKNLPDSGDREAWMAEGVASYKTFISGLLDITDNLIEGETIPPDQVVRHDGDDSYLVVAADKGTATFSDIANGVAQDYGFWLGDAFASGGSVGYDHKAMGITARGAWVSVQRHFREMGVDCQTEEHTCVGIGDMSGDVFGNGLLCSRTTRLIAAFDHRDIFIDPNPVTEAAYLERVRLFELPRSSWKDYDPALISAGGGVFSRSLKAISISPQIREALGLDETVTSMTPAELMRAILLAPVDLLWNGGIGTYVKARSETDAQAGDKANDAIRVNGRELRVKCVGEGGNLGLTQLGRIEYAERGGRINTDFIDNSAGVDTSDHEVNIKILLDGVVSEGKLAQDQRNELLASMTNEVADLVLKDNYEQNLALANAAWNSAGLLHVHEDWIKRLERDGVINRELEALPTSREVRRRLEKGGSLTVPELAVVLAWTKIVLADVLMESDVPEDPFFRSDLFSYFPSPMRQDYRPAMEQHPLRRQIIVTQVVNDLINGAGMTYWPRLAGETGASPSELVRANFVAREIFGSLDLRQQLESLDNKLPAAVQTRMRIEMRTLVERASRWLVTNRRPPIDSEGIVDFFGVTVQRVMAQLPSIMTGRELTAFEQRRASLMEEGVAEELATRVAVLPPAYMLLGVAETAARDGLDPVEVARVHFALGERLGLALLVSRILALPRDDRWQTMARAALRDDLHAVHAQLTSQAMALSGAAEPAPARVATWEEGDETMIGRAAETLQEICSDEDADLARLSVGLRVVRGLVRTT